MSGSIWAWTSTLYNPRLPDFHVVKGVSWACSITIPGAVYRAQGTGLRVAIDPAG